MLDVFNNQSRILTQKMYKAHFLIGILFGLTTLTAWSGDLTQARQALDAGAAQWSVEQLDAMPQPATDPERAEWLQLTWQALKMAGNDQAIVDHAAKLPDDAPPTLQHDVDWLAAESALKLGDGALARHYLRRLLWQFPPQPAEFAALRAMVVNSHLLPQPDAEVVSLMLRYQQEFGTDAALRLSYVLAMLRAGRVADLAAVRTSLPNQDPLAMLIDANNPELSDSVIRQRILALLATHPQPDMLALLIKPAATLHDDATQAQVSEQVLNLPDLPAGVDAVSLWKNYHGLTQSFGNVRLLLFGSDAGWADQATAVLADDPLMARAIWSYLAREAKDAALKAQAQQMLLDQLSAAQLGRTALRLFEAVWPDLPAQAFTPPVQYRLGALALAVGDDAHAAALWQDASILPQGGNVAVWQAQRALLFGRLHAWNMASAPAAAWFSQPDVMAGDTAWPMILLVKQLSEQPDQTRQAQDLLSHMWPQANPAQQRVIALQLGRLAATAQPLEAAHWYLSATVGADEHSAWQAKLNAAACLQRAGLSGDARRMYQQAAAHAPDAAMQAEAQDALGHQ